MEIEVEERERDRKLINFADVGCTWGKQVIMSSSHKWPLCPPTLSRSVSLSSNFSPKVSCRLKKYLQIYLYTLRLLIGLCLRFWLYSPT